MTALILGLGLAVMASVALNASYLLQHAGSRAAPAVDVRRPLITLTALLRSRWWLAGAAAGILGSALHVAALAQAPLSLVQAFAAGGLALSVPVAARAFGQRLARTELIALVVLVAALTLLGLGAGAIVTETVPTGALGTWIAVAALAAGALALPRAGKRRAHLLGAAGGVLYGAADAATKALTMTHGGLIAAVTSPWMVVLVLLCVAAFACFQRGLQIGPAVPVVAVMTGATNAVAILIGILVFGEPLGSTPAFAALHLGAFLLAGVAGLTLAAAQGRLAPDEPRADLHVTRHRTGSRAELRRDATRRGARSTAAAPRVKPASSAGHAGGPRARTRLP